MNWIFDMLVYFESFITELEIYYFLRILLSIPCDCNVFTLELEYIQKLVLTSCIFGRNNESHVDSHLIHRELPAQV